MSEGFRSCWCERGAAVSSRSRPRNSTEGVEAALADRPVSPAALAELLDDVEAAATAQGGPMSSETIGRLVLDGLRVLDEVAYLRFASVYKDFQGADDFGREVAALEGDSAERVEARSERIRLRSVLASSNSPERVSSPDWASRAELPIEVGHGCLGGRPGRPATGHPGSGPASPSSPSTNPRT